MYFKIVGRLNSHLVTESFTSSSLVRLEHLTTHQFKKFFTEEHLRDFFLMYFYDHISDDRDELAEDIEFENSLEFINFNNTSVYGEFYKASLSNFIAGKPITLKVYINNEDMLIITVQALVKKSQFNEIDFKIGDVTRGIKVTTTKFSDIY